MSLEKVIAFFSLPVSAPLGRGLPAETAKQKENNASTKIVFFIEWSLQRKQAP